MLGSGSFLLFQVVGFRLSGEEAKPKCPPNRRQFGFDQIPPGFGNPGGRANALGRGNADTHRPGLWLLSYLDASLPPGVHHGGDVVNLRHTHLQGATRIDTEHFDMVCIQPYVL